MIKRTSRTVAEILLAVSLLVPGPIVLPAWAQAPAVDPRSLVGEWQGTWRGGTHIRETSGRYSLTIARVDGNAVFGTVDGVGAQATFTYPVQGSVTGNTLRFTNPRGIATELVVSGNTMTGTSPGGVARQEIEIMKVK